MNKDFMLGLGIALGAPIVDRTGTLQVAKYMQLDEPEFTSNARRELSKLPILRTITNPSEVRLEIFVRI